MLITSILLYWHISGVVWSIMFTCPTWIPMMSNGSEHLSAEVIEFNSRKMQYQHQRWVGCVWNTCCWDTCVWDTHDRHNITFPKRSAHPVQNMSPVHICNVLHRTHVIDSYILDLHLICSSYPSYMLNSSVSKWTSCQCPRIVTNIRFQHFTGDIYAMHCIGNM